MAAPPTEKSLQDPVQAKTVNFSDLNEETLVSEDQASCEDRTLTWEEAERAGLSDDAKLATTALDDEPSEQERKPSLMGSREFYVLPSSIEKSLQDSSPNQTIGVPNDEEDNQMPEAAKQVFVPHVQIAVGNHVLPQSQWSLSSRRRSKATVEAYELESCGNESCNQEKQAFFAQDDPNSSKHICQAERMEWAEEDEAAQKPRCCKACSSRNLKTVASFLGAVVIFPCLLYGAYVFLPFDAPLMPGISTRLIYTLRCSVFATVPVVIGLVVCGISHLCFSSTDPFHHHGECVKQEREVALHQHFISQSVQLFVLYFLNLAVLATYLPQETLKLIPLLTGFFALSRLIYWLSFAVGRAFRGFGYGLTFLPLLTMLVCNLYFVFVVEPDKMFAVEGDATAKAQTPDAASKVRLWG
uniref:Transmembrane protein 79 n=1 Tax=Geotrypetes seraphini TaxID=260995 RepID=A0A6P8P7R3_GEOSA|nr:transmembrane protein 79 [Geotrypetes seraphini]XP_033779750.1 transmembrane protein 79 [Geotrypetes seraphini]XP_033779751.1 transmembrane protein 79 [Geotrypetes seraphini]